MNPMWNEEEADHYQSLVEWLEANVSYLMPDDVHDIAYYSAELLRFKRQF